MEKKTENYGHAILNVESNGESVKERDMKGLLEYKGDSSEGQPVFNFSESDAVCLEPTRVWLPRKVNSSLNMRVTRNRKTSEWRVQFRLTPGQIDGLTYAQYGVYEEALDEALAFMEGAREGEKRQEKLAARPKRTRAKKGGAA